VLSSRAAQRTAAQGSRDLTRQALLSALINRRPVSTVFSQRIGRFPSFVQRAIDTSGNVPPSSSTLPGRSSKRLPQDQPVAHGPTGGTGPVGTPGGPTHLTGTHFTLKHLGHALHDLATFQFEHSGSYGQFKHPNQTIAALSRPRELIKSAREYATQSALEQGSFGAYKSRSIPHIDPKKLVIDTPRALIEHPGAIPKTLKDLALLPVAAPAGVVGAIADPVKAYKVFAADTNRRYSGSAEKFRARIGKEGAAPEITDAFAFGAPQAKVLGEGLGQVARSGSAGGRAKRFTTAPRPQLRTSGNTARAQDLSTNLFRASLQRLEDRRRAGRTARLNRKHPDAKPGLQPRGGVGPHGRPAEVVPLFQKRAQRVDASRVQSRNFQAFQHQQHQEVRRGAQREVSKLNRHQQRAVFHSLQGLVSLDNPRLAVEQLLARRERIVGAWQERGLKSEPPEAKTIDYLVRHAEKVFTPELAKFHAGEVARGGRVGHVGVSDHVAEARRYRPQARELGIEYPYLVQRDAIRSTYKARLAKTRDANVAKRIAAERDQKFAELDARRPELDRQFVADVQQAAAKRGLPEPVYVQHFKHPSDVEGRSAYALGGRTAAPGVKQSELQLIDTGRADTSSQAYLQSLARTIKRGHNWRLMAQQVDAHAFPNPTAAELEAAFGHKHVDPGQLTADEWKTILTHRGVDHSEYALWSPGKFQREVVHAAAGDAQHGASRVGQHDLNELQGAFESAAGPAEQATDRFGREQGVRLIPREAYQEIHSTVKGSTAAGRFVDKLQGLQSTVLLGTNPSWLQMQIGANAFLTGFGVRGNVAAFVKAPLFFRTLDRRTRQAADELFGVGVGEAHSRNARLGAATNSRMIDGYRAMRAALGFKAQAVKNAVPLVRDLPTLNPVHLMFALDNAQNRYFKRVVLYNEAKRQAFRDMATEGGTAVRLQGQIAHLMTLGPKARIEAILRDPQLLERHAQAVDNVLGNYVRYTAKERRTFKRYVLFYGFMRYSLRTLFYTLPVRHPIVASVAAKLAELHNQEVTQLLGKGAPPWAYAAIYTGTRFNERTGKVEFTDPAVRSGKKPARSIGLGRLNPVTNPLVDISTQGPKAFGAFISPVAQIALNQMYGKNMFTGRVYEPGTSGWRRVVNELGQLAFPYRAALKQTQPGPAKYYRSDTLLFDPRVKRYKTPAKRREQRRAIAVARGSGQAWLEQLVPFIPRQDFTRQSVLARQKKAGKKKGGGGNLFSPGGGSGGSGSFMAPHPQLHAPGVQLAGLLPGGAEGAPGPSAPTDKVLADTAAAFFAPGSQLTTAAGRLGKAGQVSPVAFKPRLFAHPQRPATGKLGAAQLAAAAKGVPAAVATPGAATSSAQIDQILAKDSKFGRRVHGAIVKQMRQEGFSDQQIVQKLTGGAKVSFKAVGKPARLQWANNVLKGLKAIAPTGGQKGEVHSAATRHGVPPAILWGVYGAETRFGALKNNSTAGAQGPFQFMPGTADTWVPGGRANIQNFPKAAEGAARFLSSLHKTFGNWDQAIAAYNAGPGRVGNSNPSTWPAETQAYVPRVKQLASQFGKGGQGVKLTPRQKRALKIVQTAQRATGRRAPAGVQQFLASNSPNSTGPSTGVATAPVSAPSVGIASAGAAATGSSKSTSSQPVTAAQTAADQQIATVLQQLITRGHGPDSPLLTSGLLSVLFPGAQLPASFASTGDGAAETGGVPLLSALLADLQAPRRRRALAGAV
jgi:hypothetical protein